VTGAGFFRTLEANLARPFKELKYRDGRTVAQKRYDDYLPVRGSCPNGYSAEDIRELFIAIYGEEAVALVTERFRKFMEGQTMMLCEGRSYNHGAGEYEPSPCAAHPHGPVCYTDDVYRFVQGLPVVD
jgi:hypothetical protein